MRRQRADDDRDQQPEASPEQQYGPELADRLLHLRKGCGYPHDPQVPMTPRHVEHGRAHRRTETNRTAEAAVEGLHHLRTSIMLLGRKHPGKGQLRVPQEVTRAGDDGHADPARLAERVGNSIDLAGVGHRVQISQGLSGQGRGMTQTQLDLLRQHAPQLRFQKQTCRRADSANQPDRHKEKAATQP